jgi:hypothetical protein
MPRAALYGRKLLREYHKFLVHGWHCWVLWGTGGVVECADAMMRTSQPLSGQAAYTASLPTILPAPVYPGHRRLRIVVHKLALDLYAFSWAV